MTTRSLTNVFRPTLETLTDRIVPAGASLSDNILRVVDFDGQDDKVEVRQVNGQLSVYLNDRKFGITRQPGSTPLGTVPVTSVTRIEINGSGGNDTIDLRQGAGEQAITLPVSIKGGAGNDTIWAGNGNDTVDGEAGKDVIDGMSGNDMLRGGDGDDLLRGGDGDDILRGGNGNDRLYGNNGNDNMAGGNGNDGLYGGNGADTLRGDSGADRFLYQTGDTLPTNLGSMDAVITFSDTGGVRSDIADAWTPEHIEFLDEAMTLLHERTGNTKLLKFIDGTPVTMYTTTSPGFGTVIDDGVYVPSWTNGDRSRAQFIVAHELGHIRDGGRGEDAANVAAINTFRQFGGWVNNPTEAQKVGRTESVTQGWWYLNTAVFPNDYARTNPYEDFAVSFHTYFYPSPAAGGDATLTQSRRDFFDAYFNSLK